MINHQAPLIILAALTQFLVACSSVPGSTPEPAPVNADPAVRSFALPVAQPADPAPALVPDSSEAQELVTLVSERREVDERVLRPALAIDGDAAKPLPKGLPDGAKVSFVVVDVERGTTISDRHADRDHIPASSAKLATAVVALDRLGPEHRFKTELRATGPIEAGVLKGDLILKGGGDPVLDIPDLLPLIDALAQKSVRHVDGRFLIDDTLLPRLSEIEPTQPTEAAYNPGLSALSLAFNRVNLRWHNRRSLSVETVPHLDEASFEDAAIDALPPGGVQLKRLDDGEALWQLADRGKRRLKRSLPVKDAGLHAGQVFADLARLYGIELPTPERRAERGESSLLAVHESRPLGDLVRNMLWYSNNLVAELIGLAAAKSVQGELTSLEMSADVVLSELKQYLPDTSWDGARLKNHSGLSSQARLTPAQLAAILRHGWREGLLSSTLPGSGWSGTLARRFSSPDQAFRIWAKTGSMNYAMSLSGFLLSPAHAPAAFVIMISDEEARMAYDAQPRRTRASERKAGAWKDGVEKVMDSLVARWLEQGAGEASSDLYALSLVEQNSDQ